MFERLREDIDALAVLVGMQDVFKLRAADIYRVVEIEALAGQLAPGGRRARSGGGGGPGGAGWPGAATSTRCSTSPSTGWRRSSATSTPC